MIWAFRLDIFYDCYTMVHTSPFFCSQRSINLNFSIIPVEFTAIDCFVVLQRSKRSADAEKDTEDKEDSIPGLSPQISFQEHCRPSATGFQDNDRCTLCAGGCDTSWHVSPHWPLRSHNLLGETGRNVEVEETLFDMIVFAKYIKIQSKWGNLSNAQF